LLGSFYVHSYPFVPTHNRDTPLGSTRGAKSVNHFDKDPPALGEIMAARACPFADGGALEATDRRAGRPNIAASARSCCSPASGPGGEEVDNYTSSVAPIAMYMV